MTCILNHPYTLRPFANDCDFQSILDLFIRCQKVDQLDKVHTTASLTQELQRVPNFEITEQLYFVQLQNDPSILGSIAFNWRKDINHNHIYEFHHWMVDPSRRGAGIEKILLDKVEGWLIEYGQNQSEENWLQIRIKDTQTNLIELLESTGYNIERRTIKMSRLTSQNLPIVPTLNGLFLRKPEPNEYRKVLQANDEASKDLWGYSPKTELQFQKWEQDRLFQPDNWVVAWDKKEVAGMILGYIDEDENFAFNRKLGYTEEIAVSLPWRQKGLARWLLTESINMFRNKGMEETALSVDSLNQSQAYPFYIKMGYRPIGEYRYYRKSLPTRIV